MLASVIRFLAFGIASHGSNALANPKLVHGSVSKKVSLTKPPTRNRDFCQISLLISKPPGPKKLLFIENMREHQSRNRAERPKPVISQNLVFRIELAKMIKKPITYLEIQKRFWESASSLKNEVTRRATFIFQR